MAKLTNRSSNGTWFHDTVIKTTVNKLTKALGEAQIIGNDGSMILIAEPIENFEGYKKNHILEDYKNNDYYLKYENNKWTLITPNQ